jgi:hypothetical protein
MPACGELGGQAGGVVAHAADVGRVFRGHQADTHLVTWD